MTKPELEQLFENNYNCYADTTNEEVILAMTKEKFVEIVSQMQLPVGVPKASQQNDQTKAFNTLMTKKIEGLKEEILKTNDSTKILYLTRLLSEITSIFRLVNNMFGS